MTDLVPVRVPCPSGQHPDGDSVSLKPKLGLAAGTTIQGTITNLGKGVTFAEASGRLLELFLKYGVAEWTLHDEDGKDIELTPETLQSELLDDFARSESLADEADRLYSPVVVLPLVDDLLKSSRATRAARSTSASKSSPASRRKRSKPSSTSTTRTAAIAPTTA